MTTKPRRPRKAKPTPKAPENLVKAWSERDLAELPKLAWRERHVGVAAAGLIAALGLAVAFAAPRPFEATSSMLVLLDDAYVLDPVVGDAGAGATLSPREIVRSETALIGSLETRRRAVAALGVETAFPNIARRARTEAAAAAAAAKEIEERLSIASEPSSPTITVGFKSGDAEQAARVLNGVVDAYLDYRREVLFDFDVDGYAAQRAEAEDRLATLNTEIEAFLADAGVGDYDGARLAAQRRSADIEDERLRTLAALSEAEARLGALTERLNSTPREVNLYVDDSASERLQQLLVEREELLSRYTPESKPVSAIDERISRLRASMQIGGVDGGLTRRGANPVRQALETERNEVAGEVSALTAKAAALTGQLAQVKAGQMTLQNIAPDHARLVRERAALETSVERLAAREEEARARAVSVERSRGNVRVVERAAPPAERASLRGALSILALLLGAVFGLTAAIARGLWIDSGRADPIAAALEKVRPGKPAAESQDAA